ncbi:hypothetical protein FRC01_002795 [Tulasnella sp. 417]|nr:hypothetical protein FRC01_002795 [Tulasnella sp. 417]
MVTETTHQLLRVNEEPIINQLPIELVLQIFESVLGRCDHGHGWTYYHRLLCILSRVCARWYSIIQHSPQLWTTVPGFIEDEALRTLLERSSGNNIDLNCNYPVVYFTKCFDILGSASERWRTLSLKTPRNVTLEHKTHDFLQLPAPNLERFSFKSTDWDLVDMRNVEFFSGNCPSLREIEISGVTCEWSQPAFKGLEILKLSYVDFDTVGPILDIIRPLSQLRKLEVYKCVIKEKLSPPTQPVLLPNLQFLRVEFHSDGEVKIPTEQLLNHILAPPACPLYTSLDNYNVVQEGPVAEIFCEWLFGRQTKAVLEGVERLTLGFVSSEDDLHGLVTFELHSGSAKIKGGFKDSDMGERASKTFTKLIVSEERAYLLDDSEIIASFQELPPITHLEVIRPEWNNPNSRSEDTSDSDGLAYSTIKNVVLRKVLPDRILGIVLGALGDSQQYGPLITNWRVEDLDHVEIHVEAFCEVEAAVEALRNDPRIGKVDLYFAL